MCNVWALGLQQQRCLGKNSNSQRPPQTTESETLGVRAAWVLITSGSGDSDALQSLRTAGLEQGVSPLALLMLWAGSFMLVGAVLCTVGGWPTSLASTHWSPGVGYSPAPVMTVKHLQIVPGVLWGANCPRGEPLARGVSQTQDYVKPWTHPVAWAPCWAVPLLGHLILAL